MNKDKTKFIYLAFKENGDVLLGKDRKPVISSPTLEGDDINWGNKLYGYPKEKIKIREEYREVCWTKKDKEHYQKLYNKANELMSNKNTENTKTDISKEKQDKESSLTENKGIEAIAATVDKNPIEKEEKSPVDNMPTEYIQIQNSILKAEKSITEKSDKDLDLMLENIAKIDDQLKDNKREDNQLKNGLEILAKDLKNISHKVDMMKSTIERADSAKTITPYIDKIANEIKSNKKNLLSKQKSINEELGELRDSTQTIEGRLKQLDEILTSKYIEITREFPFVCEEEKDIMNLVMYSKKISEQLGYAARELIRKKAAFENQEQSIVNEQKIAEQRETKAYNNGKLDIIKQLLLKYTDVDVIINSKDNHLHCIWTFLKEIGVEIDGDGCYEKGKELELKETDVEKMTARYRGINGAGRYRVIKTGLKFGEEVVFAAEFEKIMEEPIKESEKKQTENVLIPV